MAQCARKEELDVLDAVRKVIQGISMLDVAGPVFLSYFHNESIDAHLHFKL